MMENLIFLRSPPKACHYGTGVERVLFLFLNDFIEQFPTINLGVSTKRAHTPHIEPCLRIAIPLQITSYASLICLSRILSLAVILSYSPIME